MPSPPPCMDRHFHWRPGGVEIAGADLVGGGFRQAERPKAEERLSLSSIYCFSAVIFSLLVCFILYLPACLRYICGARGAPGGGQAD